MPLLLTTLSLLAASPELAHSYCQQESFDATYRLPEGRLTLEGRYHARFALTSLRQLPVSLPQVGAAIATLGWGDEPCLFVQRGSTLLRFCLETPAILARRQAMTMQMMPGPEAAGPPPGIEQSFVAAFVAADAAAVARHPFSLAAVEVMRSLGAGAAVGVTRRASIRTIQATINGRRVEVDRQRLPAALGDEAEVRFAVEVRETRCGVGGVETKAADPAHLSGTLEQGNVVRDGARDGASLRFGLGRVTSLRRHRYRIEVDGQALTGELLHRYGASSERRLERGTDRTALTPPRGASAAALREQILRELEGSYDSDHHRLGVSWVQPGLRADLARRGALGAAGLKLLAAPPARVLLHGRAADRPGRRAPPLRHADLRLSGPYADTWKNPTGGPDVIWEAALAHDLFVELRFAGASAETERLATFLSEQMTAQIEPTVCRYSKNRQCAIEASSAEGHAWALLAFARLAASGGQPYAAATARSIEHLERHHLGKTGRTEPSGEQDWHERIQEQLLVATALRQLRQVAGADLAAAAEGELLRLVVAGYAELRLDLLADVYDYLTGSTFLLGGP